MHNKEGKFIGHSSRQSRYLELNERNVRFQLKGHTIYTNYDRFPIAMAKALNTRPRNCPDLTTAFWNKI